MSPHSSASYRRLSYTQLEIENEMLWRKLEELTAELEQAREELGKNSRNSSMPPSSDNQAARALRPRRRSSGRRPGKQTGSGGAWLRPRAQPDVVLEHRPACCEGCGASLVGAEAEAGETRQVLDLPPLRLLATEHRSLRVRCACGHLTKGAFPAGVEAPVQYGPGVYALGSYLTDYQLIPYQRAGEFFADVFAAPISPGTLVNVRQRGQAGLSEFEATVRDLLRQGPVTQFDETGGRVGGQGRYVHTASTPAATSYLLHEKRGREAMDAFAILPGFEGVAEHDCWHSYFGYECRHALCGAHLLRELDAVAERPGQEWAAASAGLLVEINGSVERARAEGREHLDPPVLVGYWTEYDELIERGREANPDPVQGRKRTKAGNLALRLQEHREEALRFMTDFRVPFTNNLSERDLRMVKLQQKISSCWRSEAGARAFLGMRGYLSTVRKNQVRVIDALRLLFTGRPWLPQAASP